MKKIKFYFTIVFVVDSILSFLYKKNFGQGGMPESFLKDTPL